jgi:hypothetical protein
MLEKIKALLPFNFDLMGNPYNWVLVALIVAIGGAAVATVLSSGPIADEE